ncbi:MAG: putative DNA binding domain-containing protein [Proteobacteria bacterium]|nr:putative DNA binding domain-containing protein [Pseudomonadota bacterium]
MEFETMNAIELLDIINMGETSKVQFKVNLFSPDQLAAEMVAMSNSLGGMILIGVKDKTGEITGLDYDKLQEYNNQIGNIATNKVIPNIYVTSEVVSVDNKGSKKVLIIHIREGINKPYKDNNLSVWVKQGSDKRRVTDNLEMLRLFQSSGNLSADEMEVYGSSIKDIDKDKFEQYFKKEFQQTIKEKNLDFEKALKIKKAIRKDQLTLAGLLFFGKEPQHYRQAFCIKAVSFWGNSIGGNEYKDSRDIVGTIPDMFYEGIRFFNVNLKHTQQDQNFNSPGILEISKIALEELLQNALLHRDYFKNSPIRLMIFDNRIEIISPGKLPNNLTVEEIKYGNPVIRNNQLVAYAVHILPYKGLGSGIKRAIESQPDIEFINDIDGEQFIVKIPRPDNDISG